MSSQFSFGRRLGLLFIAEASCLSACAIITLFSYFAYSAVSLRRRSQRRWKMETPVHYYFLNLMFCDLLEAIGGMLNIRWIAVAEVRENSLCVAQGVLKQVGDVGTALSVLTIAFFTFNALVFRWKADAHKARGLLVIFGIWVALGLIVGINVGVNGASRFYGDTGNWCWIANGYPVQRLVLDYVVMWVAAFFSILLYVPLFLVLKGKIIVDGWRVRVPRKEESQTMPRNDGIAMKMLLYPLIYIITVLPIAVVRYITFKPGVTVPFAATVVADVLFCSSGLFNVILYIITRPFLLPHRPKYRGHWSDSPCAGSNFSYSMHPPQFATMHIPSSDISSERYSDTFDMSTVPHISSRDALGANLMGEPRSSPPSFAVLSTASRHGGRRSVLRSSMTKVKRSSSLPV